VPGKGAGEGHGAPRPDADHRPPRPRPPRARARPRRCRPVTHWGPPPRAGRPPPGGPRRAPDSRPHPSPGTGQSPFPTAAPSHAVPYGPGSAGPPPASLPQPPGVGGAPLPAPALPGTLPPNHPPPRAEGRGQGLRREAWRPAGGGGSRGRENPDGDTRAAGRRGGWGGAGQGPEARRGAGGARRPRDGPRAAGRPTTTGRGRPAQGRRRGRRRGGASGPATGKPPPVAPHSRETRPEDPRRAGSAGRGEAVVAGATGGGVGGGARGSPPPEPSGPPPGTWRGGRAGRGTHAGGGDAAPPPGARRGGGATPRPRTRLPSPLPFPIPRRTGVAAAEGEAREPGGAALGTRPPRVNDPSAGSPTETLLRLLLPLDSQVRPSSQRSARAVGRPRRGRSEGLTKPSNRINQVGGSERDDEEPGVPVGGGVGRGRPPRGEGAERGGGGREGRSPGRETRPPRSRPRRGRPTARPTLGVREGRGASPPPRGRHEGGAGWCGGEEGGGPPCSLPPPSRPARATPGTADARPRRPSVHPPQSGAGDAGRRGRGDRPAAGQDRGPVPRSGERTGAGAPPRPARDGGGGGGGDTGDGSGPRRAREARHTGARGPGEQQTARGPRRTDGRRGAPTGCGHAGPTPRNRRRGWGGRAPPRGERPKASRGRGRESAAGAHRGISPPQALPAQGRSRGATRDEGLAPPPSRGSRPPPPPPPEPQPARGEHSPAAHRRPPPHGPHARGAPPPRPPRSGLSEGTAPLRPGTPPARQGPGDDTHVKARRGRLGPGQGTGTRAVARAGRGEARRGRRRRGGAGEHARRGPRDRDAGAVRGPEEKDRATRPGPQEHQRGIPPPPAREGGPATPGAPAGPGHPRSVARDPAPPPGSVFRLSLNPEARPPGDDALERGGPDRDRTPPPAAAQGARAGLTPRGPAARTRPPTCRTPGGAQRDPPPTRRGEARAARRRSHRGRAVPPPDRLAFGLTEALHEPPGLSRAGGVCGTGKRTTTQERVRGQGQSRARVPPPARPHPPRPPRRGERARLSLPPRPPRKTATLGTHTPPWRGPEGDAGLRETTPPLGLRHLRDDLERSRGTTEGHTRHARTPAWGAQRGSGGTALPATGRAARRAHAEEAKREQSAVSEDQRPPLTPRGRGRETEDQGQRPHPTPAFLTLPDGQRGGKTSEGPRGQTEKSGHVHRERPSLVRHGFGSARENTTTPHRSVEPRWSRGRHGEDSHQRGPLSASPAASIPPPPRLRRERPTTPRGEHLTGGAEPTGRGSSQPPPGAHSGGEGRRG
ncbi:PREDICTED: collagen alpha-1(I) chain-like, partial [Capra hircus]|uniref:collagen alpha-1(I) chain-like n=1 Tax=Capra hircus TaxID=9925 RepID=UPI0008470AA9